MEKIELQSLDLHLDWFKAKVRVNVDDRPPIYFSEREIWWASLGQNVGTEENGKHSRFERPVLILRKSSRNLVFVIPLSSVIKEGSWYFMFDFLEKRTAALLAQGRAISSRRFIRKMGTIDPHLFQEIQAAFIAYIKSESPGKTGGSSEPLARPM